MSEFKGSDSEDSDPWMGGAKLDPDDRKALPHRWDGQGSTLKDHLRWYSNYAQKAGAAETEMVRAWPEFIDPSMRQVVRVFMKEFRISTWRQLRKWATNQWPNRAEDELVTLEEIDELCSVQANFDIFTREQLTTWESSFLPKATLFLKQQPSQEGALDRLFWKSLSPATVNELLRWGLDLSKYWRGSNFPPYPRVMSYLHRMTHKGNAMHQMHIEQVRPDLPRKSEMAREALRQQERGRRQAELDLRRTGTGAGRETDFRRVEVARAREQVVGAPVEELIDKLGSLRIEAATARLQDRTRMDVEYEAVMGELKLVSPAAAQGLPQRLADAAPPLPQTKNANEVLRRAREVEMDPSRGPRSIEYQSIYAKAVYLGVDRLLTTKPVYGGQAAQVSAVGSARPDTGGGRPPGRRASFSRDAPPHVNSQRERGACFICDKEGHFSRGCPAVQPWIQAGFVRFGISDSEMGVLHFVKGRGGSPERVRRFGPQRCLLDAVRDRWAQERPGQAMPEAQALNEVDVLHEGEDYDHGPVEVPEEEESVYYDHGVLEGAVGAFTIDAWSGPELTASANWASVDAAIRTPSAPRAVPYSVTVRAEKPKGSERIEASIKPPAPAGTGVRPTPAGRPTVSGGPAPSHCAASPSAARSASASQPSRTWQGQGPSLQNTPRQTASEFARAIPPVKAAGKPPTPLRSAMAGSGQKVPATGKTAGLGGREPSTQVGRPASRSAATPAAKSAGDAFAPKVRYNGLTQGMDWVAKAREIMVSKPVGGTSLAEWCLMSPTFAAYLARKLKPIADAQSFAQVNLAAQEVAARLPTWGEDFQETVEDLQDDGLPLLTSGEAAGTTLVVTTDLVAVGQRSQDFTIASVEQAGGITHMQGVYRSQGKMWQGPPPLIVQAMLIPIEINGVAVDALLDTGACVNLISYQVWQGLGVELRQDSVLSINGVHGAAQKTMGHFEASISAAGVRTRQVLCVSDQVAADKVLLGLPFLVSSRADIFWDRNRMVLRCHTTNGVGAMAVHGPEGPLVTLFNPKAEIERVTKPLGHTAESSDAEASVVEVSLQPGEVVSIVEVAAVGASSGNVEPYGRPVNTTGRPKLTDLLRGEKRVEVGPPVAGTSRPEGSTDPSLAYGRPSRHVSFHNYDHGVEASSTNGPHYQAGRPISGEGLVARRADFDLVQANYDVARDEVTVQTLPPRGRAGRKAGSSGPQAAVSVDGVYKPVDKKKRPVATDFPEGEKPLMKEPDDIYGDLPEVRTNWKGKTRGDLPEGERLTKERMDDIYKSMEEAGF